MPTSSPKQKNDFADVWRRVRAILAADLGERPYAIWIAPLSLISADETKIVIACANEDARDAVAERYGQKIADLLARQSGLERAVDFVCPPTPHLAIVAAPQETEVSSFELRFAFLQRRAARMELERPAFAVGDDVLRMVAARIPKDGRVLEQALERLAHCSAASGEPVTFASAQIWLVEMLRSHDRRITIDEVKRCVSRRYGLKPGDLESRSRRSEIVRPRQIAMYATRLLTGKSFPDIARHFERDHSTVLYGVEKMAALARTNPEIAAELEEIKRSLRDWTAGPK
jgi:chromosomal replication initiation ATPase DnaA